MEISNAYGHHDNEPELQKMAAFLQDRCNKGKYGLQYLNPQKTHIRIPWPTVPRANEQISDSFKMFTEWAYLSFRKRGNKGDQLENEPLSAQKHRFRNALARADGLKYCKELSAEGIRVYEFADTKKDKENTENGIKSTNKSRSSTSSYVYHGEYNPNTPTQRDLTDSCSTIDYNDWGSPVTIYQGPVVTYGISPDPIDPSMSMDQEEQVSFTTLLEEIINLPEPQAVPVTEAYNGYSYPIVTEPIMTNPDVKPIPPQPYHHPAEQLVVASTSHREANGITNFVPHLEHHVIIKVMYREDEVMRRSVTNSVGFRFYSGNNIPDMSRLLDNEQRHQLAQLTRFQCEELYGPDSFEQVEMPAAPIPQTNQAVRTKQILDNMDRGLVFYLEHGAVNSAIPNVYSIRLCQTRIFPYDTNVAEKLSLEEEGLKRMNWTKIFDAGEFLHKMEKWKNCSGSPPSATIKLSVGQKPKRQELNLVSVSVTVVKAQSMVEWQLEDVPEDICISSKNSMDVAAQMLQLRIQSSFRLDENPLPRFVP